MADALVTDTSKSQLSAKNRQATNLPAASGDDIGGVDANKTMPNTVKIDGAKGVSTDSSVKGAGTNRQSTNLPAASGGAPPLPAASGTAPKTTTEDTDVSFDDDKDDDSDDIDKKLDQFEDVKPVGIVFEMVTGKRKTVKEGELPPWLKKDGDKDDDDSDDDDKKDIKEGELPPWLKKDGDDDDDDDKEDVKEDTKVIEKETIKTDGDGGDKKDDANDDSDKDSGDDESSFKKGGGDDEKSDKKDDSDDTGGDKKPNPFAKKDGGDDKKVDESLKIRIRLPKANLFESIVPTKSQKKVAVVFESAIKDVTKQISEQVSKHYKKLHETKMQQRDAVLSKQMDSYLNYVVEEWVKVNRVSIRQSLKAQMAEEFLGGLKKLFKEHWISVPDSKVDVLKKLTEEVNVLKKSLNEQHGQKMQLRKLAEAANKGRIVENFVRRNKLSEASSAKLMKLAEDVKYTNSKDFREKLGMLKESFLTENTTKKTLTRLPDETVLVEDTQRTTKTSGDADVDLIAQTISRQAKSVW